ncbi:MAG: IS1380 family transposase [Burkholderiales bacterium]|nr:IS1380 family transposase [Burkholderiales bacterium]MDE2457593.1 IS1380 family transposase [Burkholderiales bacterium]
MGEADKPKKTVLAQAGEDAMVADTMGGRVHVRWDETAQATPHGQIVFFAEFLATAGVFDRWVQTCPLHYSSPNASRVRDVLGTLMLGILAGSKRYAHIAGVRGDAVAARALGLARMVSEDSVRRALAAMAPAASEPWMRDALMASVREALDRPWVLDMDATIKPLYGHQEGAEIGYNPHKPGRPSHVLHTFWVGNLRLVLDAVLSSGKQHTSGHAKAAMARLLDELGDKAPALVRGDCGYGNEDIIDVCEQRSLSYLLRLRKTANVKRLIERLFRRDDWTRASEASQGWQAIEDKLRLSGWSKARRVVVLRRRIKNDIALTAKRHGKQEANEQLVLALPHDEVQDSAQAWEYTVLATNVEYEIAAVGQLYRDRCDCENGFDELKNQWGWGGFTTQDMHRSQITARAVALVYNWWSWYVRAANPQARREALTSRPLLLAAVGRATSSGNQTTLYLTPMHAEAGLIKSMIANVHAAIQHVKAVAEQLPKVDRWRALLAYICQRIVGQIGLPPAPAALAATG